MAQLQTTGVPIHCGYSIEKGIAIISDHEHRLSQSNVVSIDIGWKVVNVALCCSLWSAIHAIINFIPCIKVRMVEFLIPSTRPSV